MVAALGLSTPTPPPVIELCRSTTPEMVPCGVPGKITVATAGAAGLAVVVNVLLVTVTPEIDPVEADPEQAWRSTAPGGAGYCPGVPGRWKVLAVTVTLETVPVWLVP